MSDMAEERADDGWSSGDGGGDADPESAPAAPVALSVEEARKLLAERHGTVVGDDDPLLMLVTLHQGFLADYERLLARHSAALESLLGQTGDTVSGSVRESLSVLRDEALAGALRNILAKVTEEPRSSESLFERFGAASRSLIQVLSVLTAMSWLAAAAAVAVLVFG